MIVFLPGEARKGNRMNRPAKNRRVLIYPAAIFVLWVSALVVSAQPYSIDWYKVAGGGGTSSNAQFTISGTIGQAEAGGPLSGGPYSVSGGFWTIYAVQTPGAPLLHVSLTTTNTVVVSWPSPSTGFSLHVSTNL